MNLIVEKTRKNDVFEIFIHLRERRFASAEQVSAFFFSKVAASLMPGRCLKDPQQPNPAKDPSNDGTTRAALPSEAIGYW
jgi:hypothetical protein